LSNNFRELKHQTEITGFSKNKKLFGIQVKGSLIRLMSQYLMERFIAQIVEE
jgi:hypothetical protein